MELTLSTQRPHTIADNNWAKQSLRQCLLALGLTDQQIRYRKGIRYILQSWTGEEKTLISLVKKQWKSLVVQHHEATGDDPEQWKRANALYSAILKKVVFTVKNRPFIETKEYNCIICKRPVVKIIKAWTQRNSLICSQPECQKEYQNFRVRRLRNRYRPTYDRYCEICGNRFFTHDSRKKYCKDECRDVRNNNVRRASPHPTSTYAERMARLTTEEKQALHRRHYARFKRKQEHWSEEKWAEYRKKQAAIQAARRQRLTPEQRKAERLKYRQKTEAELIESQRQKWKDKPWLFETWLQVRKNKKV